MMPWAIAFFVTVAVIVFGTLISQMFDVSVMQLIKNMRSPAQYLRERRERRLREIRKQEEMRRCAIQKQEAAAQLEYRRERLQRRCDELTDWNRQFALLERPGATMDTLLAEEVLQAHYCYVNLPGNQQKNEFYWSHTNQTYVRS